MEILTRVATALNASIELEQALDATLDALAQSLALETGWIWLLDDQGEFYLAASHTLPEGLEERASWWRGGCACQSAFIDDALSTGCNYNPVTCSRLSGLSDASARGVRFHASFPIRADGESLGILNLARAGWERFDAEQIELVEAVSQLLGMAVRRTQLYEKSALLGALDERQRLSRELHDTVIQRLVALGMQLDVIDAHVQREDVDRMKGALEWCTSLVGDTLDDARRVAMELRLELLTSSQIAHRLERLAADTERGASLEVSSSFRLDEHFTPSPELSHALLHIAGEALRNVRRHAHATRVTLALEADPDGVELIVRDNGQGFVSETLAPHHLGIKGMTERAEQVGGTLHVTHAESGGVSIRFTHRYATKESTS